MTDVTNKYINHQGDFSHSVTKGADHMYSIEKRSKSGKPTVAEQEETLVSLSSEVETMLQPLHDLEHGWEHSLRVYRSAIYLAQHEQANVFIVGATALLHDVGRVRKEKGRKHADISVEMAGEILPRFQVSESEITQIQEAIRTHSYKGPRPQTLEAKIVFDADRLEGLGAIGLTRWVLYGIRQQIPLIYHPTDPFCEQREPDDKMYMLDRFATKLLKIEESMYTDTARVLTQRRKQFLLTYLDELREELFL